jgi:hypothetical protein
VLLNRLLRRCIIDTHHRADAAHKADTQNDPYDSLLVRKLDTNMVGTRTWVGRHDSERCSRAEQAARRESSQSKTATSIHETFMEIALFGGRETVACFTVEEALNEDDTSSHGSLFEWIRSESPPFFFFCLCMTYCRDSKSLPCLLVSTRPDCSRVRHESTRCIFHPQELRLP